MPPVTEPERDADALIERIRASVIGDDEAVAGPFGLRRVTYADYTATGRAPVVHRGLHPRRGPAALRQHPHRIVRDRAPDDALPRGRPGDHPRRGRGTTDDHAVIFSGAGHDRGDQHARRRARACASRPGSTSATGFGRTSRPTSGRSCSSARTSTTRTSCRGASRSPTWSRSARTQDGRIDLAQLEAALREHADRPLKIGSFSAASNVTGILSDTRAISVLLHEHGALSFWDFAAAGPYVEIEMDPHRPAPTTGPNRGVPTARRPRLQGRDRPQPPQVHRRAGHAGRAGRPARAVPQPRPDVAGWRHRRLRQPARARLPRRPGAPRGGRHARDRRVDPRGARLPAQGGGRRRRDPAARGGLHRAGDRVVARRTPRSRSSATRAAAAVDRVLHRSATTGATSTTTSSSRVLNDLFGIQSRGGCSCAGPYGHRLLGIDIETSHGFEREIARGCEGIKPGWVRVNFNYFISEAVFDYIVRAVDARRARRLAAPALVPLRAGDRPVAPRRRARPSRRCRSTMWHSRPTASPTRHIATPSPSRVRRPPGGGRADPGRPGGGARRATGRRAGRARGRRGLRIPALVLAPRRGPRGASDLNRPGQGERPSTGARPTARALIIRRYVATDRAGLSATQSVRLDWSSARISRPAGFHFAKRLHLAASRLRADPRDPAHEFRRPVDTRCRHHGTHPVQVT